MWSKLSALIEIRKIIALVMTGVFVYMVVSRQIDPIVAVGMITTVIGFYYGKSTALDRPPDR